MPKLLSLDQKEKRKRKKDVTYNFNFIKSLINQYIDFFLIVEVRVLLCWLCWRKISFKKKKLLGSISFNI